MSLSKIRLGYPPPPVRARSFARPCAAFEIVKLIDLSQPLFDDCPNCPLDPPVRFENIADHPTDGWRVEKMTLTTHSGSHLDAPLHKFAGAPSIDDFPLESFTGPAVLADFRDSRAGQPFTSSQLNIKLNLRSDLKDKILLLATSWGEHRAKNERWLHHSPFLSPDGAEWLVEQEIRGVGIDHYSIGGAIEKSNRRTHEVLLQANIWILEDLRFPPEIFSLPQPIEFWGLPIRFQNASGAFCRPVVVAER